LKIRKLKTEKFICKF